MTVPASPPNANVFDDGDIIFGGGAADALEGRAGDDIIDGDRWFNAQLCDGEPEDSANCESSLQAFKADALAGTVDPGDLEIRRSIEPGNGSGNDVALFTGEQADYTVTTLAPGRVQVVDNVGTDGTDILLNVELLQFQNNILPDGTIDDTPDPGDDVVVPVPVNTPPVVVPPVVTPPVVVPPVVTPPVVTPPVRGASGGATPLVPEEFVGLPAPFRALDTRNTCGCGADGLDHDGQRVHGWRAG